MDKKIKGVHDDVDDDDGDDGDDVPVVGVVVSVAGHLVSSSHNLH